MSTQIQIITDFDGANPAQPGRIIQTEGNDYTILPFSEDDDPNYKFRLDVKIINRSSDLQPLNLTIDWQETKFNHLRNYCYTRSGDNPWQYVPLECTGAKTHSSIKVPPGETYLCLHPKYNYEDCSDFINKLPENKGIGKKTIGVSPGGRKLWLLKRRGNGRSGKRILILARVHPYETAGSYCAEGIAQRITGNGATDGTPLDKCDIYLIPMANPDGVSNGLCKKTAVDGIDLSKSNGTPNDGTWALLEKAAASIKPHVYCEIHNWMFKDTDGIYFLNRLQARRFVKNMPPQRPFGKKWKVILRRRLFSIAPHGFKKYCRERFGSTCLCLEYPWFGRSAGDMRKLGADSLEALAKL